MTFDIVRYLFTDTKRLKEIQANLWYSSDGNDKSIERNDRYAASNATIKASYNDTAWLPNLSGLPERSQKFLPLDMFHQQPFPCSLVLAPYCRRWLVFGYG